MSSLLSKVDFHVHSIYSKEDQCAGFTIPVIYDLADKLGIEYLLLTEHWDGIELDIFKKIRGEINKYKKNHKVTIFLSAEISVVNSKGELLGDTRKVKPLLDVIAVGAAQYKDQSKRLKEDIYEDVRDMVVNLCKREDIELLLHPQIVGQSGELGLNKRPYPVEYYHEMMKAAKENDKVVECVSIQMLRPYIKFRVKEGEWNFYEKKLMEDYTHYIQAVIKNGVKFTIGTDAHNRLLSPKMGNLPWFGVTGETVNLLRKHGVDEDNLWIPSREQG